jgi:hypothetical protein
MMKIGAVAAALLLSGLSMPAFAAEPPAALVMAISGKTNPPLGAMSEIASGAKLQLDPGTELTVLDYARCKMVTVNGGSLTITRFDFMSDGKIVSEVEAPCPRFHQLSASAGGAVAGGVVMRGALGSVQRWPLEREIVLAGGGADKLKAAAICADGRPDAPLVQLTVAGNRARLPEHAPPLAVNERYLLRLAIEGSSEPVDIPFIGAAPSGRSLLVVLRGR